MNTAGKHLDQQFLEHPLRPVDELLRWHFRQAVLTNMKGTGGPAFDTDFPPCSDMMGEIMSGPKAGERMEFELFDRLNSIGNTSPNWRVDFSLETPEESISLDASKVGSSHLIKEDSGHNQER
jgi:hypothetical protein